MMAWSTKYQCANSAEATLVSFSEPLILPRTVWHPTGLVGKAGTTGDVEHRVGHRLAATLDVGERDPDQGKGASVAVEQLPIVGRELGAGDAAECVQIAELCSSLT